MFFLFMALKSYEAFFDHFCRIGLRLLIYFQFIKTYITQYYVKIIVISSTCFKLVLKQASYHNSTCLNLDPIKSMVAFQKNYFCTSEILNTAHLTLFFDNTISIYYSLPANKWTMCTEKPVLTRVFKISNVQI